MMYLLTIGTGQCYLLLHHFFTEFDQLGQAKLDGQAENLQHQLDERETWPKATILDFEAALVVDEVNHLLESLGVGVIKEEPLDPWFAQLGAEVWAGDRKEESVASKLLPEELCLEYFVMAQAGVGWWTIFTILQYCMEQWYFIEFAVKHFLFYGRLTGLPLNWAGFIWGLHKDLEVRGVGVMIGEHLLIVDLVQAHLDNKNEWHSKRSKQNPFHLKEIHKKCLL